MKNILILISVLIVSFSCAKDPAALPADSGKLSGTVTIKDLYGQDSRADAGSLIYVVREAEIATTQYRDIAMVVEMFRRNKSFYQLSVSNTADPSRVKRAKDNFDTLADYTRRFIGGFKQSAVVSAVAGETGNYTLTLEPGSYYILVISGSLRSDNLLEKNGNIELRTVNIKPSAETRLGVTFEKQEQMWIKLVAGWQQEGC